MTNISVLLHSRFLHKLCAQYLQYFVTDTTYSFCVLFSQQVWLIYSGYVNTIPGSSVSIRYSVNIAFILLDTNYIIIVIFLSSSC